jgi:hypothetical protein
MRSFVAHFPARLRIWRASCVGFTRNPSTTLGLVVASTMICISAAATKPTGYGDLAWQRWIGEAIIRSHRIPTALGDETFTAAGAPWVPQEWLFAVGTTILQNPFFAGLFRICRCP